jgi:hypothetical protein
MPHIRLIDAEYDPGRLRAIRSRATLYLHGHSAGGTNPALVEMMGFRPPHRRLGLRLQPRHDRKRRRLFRQRRKPPRAPPRPDRSGTAPTMAKTLQAIARRRYRWDDVTQAYFRLLGL